MTAGQFDWDRADEAEGSFARRLDKVRLVVELELDEDSIRRAQETLAAVAADVARVHGPAKLTRRYPALTLISLVGHAALSYAQGSYWESFWHEFGIPRAADFENMLRHDLDRLLRQFGLRQFPEIRGGYRYVFVMAMHAGIPVTCLGDLVDVIEQHILAGREPTGAAVIEWLTEPGMEYRVNLVDRPVQNFLQLGGEIAVDIVDRIIEFLGYAAEHDVANDLDLSPETTGLPPVLLDGLIDLLGDRAAGNLPVPGSREHLRYASLCYSLADEQVMVTIPYPTTEPDVAWRMSSGGDTRTVYAERTWGVPDDEQPPTWTAVTEPVRDVLLRHDPSDVEHHVGVVDRRDPLLLFDVDGRLLSKRSTVPRGEVVAVYPRDGVVVDPATSEAAKLVGTHAVPTGWSGWLRQVIDVSRLGGLQLRRGSELVGQARAVRAVGAATLEFGSPLVGVTTGNGTAVFPTRPKVLLPPHLGDEPIEWRVRVRRSGELAWLCDEIWLSDTERAELDPFDDLDTSLLGLFEIAITGPLGSDLPKTVFVAEGLVVEHSVVCRMPIDGGLSPCHTSVRVPTPLSVDRDRIDFDPKIRETSIRISAAGRVVKLLVRPPHFEYRIDILGRPAEWRTTFTVLSPADLEEYAVVAVRAPGDTTVDMILTDPAGKVVQIATPTTSAAERVFQVQTREFVDTVRRVGESRLAARLRAPDGRERMVTLAQMRRAALCATARVDDGVLVLERAATAELGAFIWRCTAPWQPVRRVGFTDGRALLPDDLRGAGPLLVQVFVDDPWSVIPVPRKPDHTALLVVQPGSALEDNAALAQLSRFLSGAADAPDSPDAAVGAWAALAILPDDAGGVRLRLTLTTLLTRHPRAALDALARTPVPEAELPAMLIRSGLGEASFAGVAATTVSHPNPLLGCLAEIADLPMHVLRRDPAEQTAPVRAYLAEQGGDTLIELLGGIVANPREGVFDKGSAALQDMSSERIDRIVESMRLVPGPLLDLDTRTAANIEAFRARAAWMRDPTADKLLSCAPVALTAVRQASRLVYDAVRIRNEALDDANARGSRRWLLLSMESLALAALARLQARGMFDQPRMTTDMRAAWTRMAELCPRLVATDLLIADALASFATHADLIGALP